MGSKPITFIPKFKQALATFTPIAPSPITPIVFPGNSYPTYLFFPSSILVLKSSGLFVFSRSGHAINLEEPIMFNQEVHKFLSAVERGKWKKRDEKSILNNALNLGLTNK